MMQLKDVLKNKKGEPVTVLETSTVAFAIRTMHAKWVGSVMVQGADGGPVGILTERDILRLYAEGAGDFESIAVKDWMTTDMHIGKPSDTVSEVLSVMTAKRFRHMPVMEDGKMVGVVSIGDLVKAKLEEASVEAQNLREYIHS